MDKLEAAKILSQHIGRFTDYADVVPLAESKHIKRFDAVGAGGVKYKIEVRFFWQDDAIRRNIRVAGSISERTRGSVPLGQTLLVPPPESAI